MSEALIRLSKVGVHVRDKRILHHVDLDIERGKIVTIIGPNGAGKSTLVKVVLGLMDESSGDIYRNKGVRFGYVPQQLSLDQSLPIKVSRFLSLADINKAARVEALEFLKIRHLGSRQVHSLSGGEFQRVMLARAIARKPDLLVLDEPLQGVDITGQVELYELIASVREKYGCGILMVSHDLHLVMAQTDTVICLNQHVCCQGQPESVSRHPEYLKLFGQNAADKLAVYQHHHDHHHNLHGDAVDCNEACHHD